MALEVGKKIIIVYILQILQKYSDAEHPMSQLQIAEKLAKDHGLQVDRATVKRNLEELVDAGVSIQYKEVIRFHTNKKTGERAETTIYTDLYYEHEFTEPELLMLIDGILFSRSVPYKQRRQLIDKLGSLSSVYFNRRLGRVRCLSPDAPQNPELFHIIDILDEAITRKKQVEITYNQYGTDLKLHPGTNEDGTVKRQILNPYQMVASEGRYYLICNNDHYDTAANYRIDRMTNIVLLENSKVKPMSKVKELEKGLNLSDYVFQNLNMFSGEIVDAEFIIQRKFISLVIDCFGKHVSFHEQEDGTVCCRMKVSQPAMKIWAVEHANIVRVISPEPLVEEIREEIRKANELYEI